VSVRLSTALIGLLTPRFAPRSLSFLLDCYASAVGCHFRGTFPLKGNRHLVVLNENNVNSASDDLIARAAQLLFDHRRAGDTFFTRLLKGNGSAAWCCRLLSPVLEQVHATKKTCSSSGA
jgi:hypothetical protein